ncbi:MAG TPA: hypothetical protein VK053_16580 [Jiangellaceae bacterium]|nr:hypothetical protein [Jiangellaceae bacterium]
MASVRLKAIWLNDADNPADALALNLVRSFRKVPATRLGQVRRNAAGLTRLVTRPGREVSWMLVFGTTTPVEKQWIEDHAGEVLCVRDNRGGKFFAAYLAPSWDERTWSHDADNVTLELVEISTFTEEV